MSGRILADRDRGKQQPSLAAGVVSRAKRKEFTSTPVDFTPPGKENCAQRLAANTAVDRDCSRVQMASSRSVRPASDQSDNAVAEMDAAFVAESSTSAFGSDADGRLPTETAKSHGDQDQDYDEDDVTDREDADEEEDGAAARQGRHRLGGSRVIYQDCSVQSPQSISVQMSVSTPGLPAVRKFAEAEASGTKITPGRTASDLRLMHTPVNDVTMDSIAPTDIDESYLVGGVTVAMPPASAPSFRRYANLVSPASNDMSADDLAIEPYPGTPSPSPQKRRSRTPDGADKFKFQPDASHTYALPCRHNSQEAAPSTPSQASFDEEQPSAKKVCIPLISKSGSISDSPLAPTPAHAAMMGKIKHLREVIDRDSSLEKQARQALQHCLASDATGSQQELEAERLLLLAELRSSRCTSEIERLRQQVADPVSISSAASCQTAALDHCQAGLALSGIWVPLHLNFLTTIGRDSVAHFVVVARCGCDVIATTHVQSSREICGLGGELKFRDNLVLSPVPVNLQLDIELYYMINSRKGTDSDLAPLTPRKRRLLGQHGALSKLTPRKQRTASTASTGAAAMTRFTLGASCQLSLDTLKLDTRCKMQEWSSHQLLHGPLELHAKGQPLYSQHSYSGFLTWREEISGQPNWRRFWCQLDGAALRAWQYPADQEAEMEPIQQLDLEQLNQADSKITAAAPSSQVCIRKNSIVINVDHPQEEQKRFLFFADSKENQVLWIAALQQACRNLEVWKALPR